MSAVGTLIPSGGAASQVRYNFTPTIMPTTVGDWTVAYATQAGVMIVDGVMAWTEITLSFTPTFTTAATGNLRIGTLPITPVSTVGNFQFQDPTNNITWPTSTTMMIGRMANDLGAISIYGLRSGAAAAGLGPSGLVSAGFHRIVLAGWVRVA